MAYGYLRWNGWHFTFFADQLSKRDLEVLFEFLPYCFCLTCQNFARNLSYYYVHMQAWEDGNIVAYKYLEKGDLSSSLTDKPHPRIPFDQVIKMTINRPYKDIGRLSGKTQNPGATEGWTKKHCHIVVLCEHLNKKIKQKTKERHMCLVLPESNKIKKMWGISWHILMHGFLQCGKKVIPQQILLQVRLWQMIWRTTSLIWKGIARDEFVGTFTKVNTKLNYYDPIKQQLFKLFEKKTTKKNHSIPEDECQSFTDIFAMYNEKKLDLRKIMDYYVTSEPWVIVNKDEKSCNNNNHVSKSFTKLISYF